MSSSVRHPPPGESGLTRPTRAPHDIYIRLGDIYTDTHTGTAHGSSEPLGRAAAAPRAALRSPRGRLARVVARYRLALARARRRPAPNLPRSSATRTALREPANPAHVTSDREIDNTPPMTVDGRDAATHERRRPPRPSSLLAPRSRCHRPTATPTASPPSTCHVHLVSYAVARPAPLV